MDLGEAIKAMKHGMRVKRSGWNNTEQYVEMQSPDENSKMTDLYAYITTQTGARVPWVASQADLFAEDWLWRAGTTTSWLDRSIPQDTEVDEDEAEPMTLAFIAAKPAIVFQGNTYLIPQEGKLALVIDHQGVTVEAVTIEHGIVTNITITRGP